MRLPLAACAVAATSALAQGPAHKQIVRDLRLDAVAEDFPGIDRLAIGPHGQIAVWIRQDQSLRLYDSTGAKIAAFGRKGAGPGESRAVNAVGFKADTFWHFDVSLNRLTFVTPLGKLLRHEVLPPSMNRGAALDSTRGDVRGAMYSFHPVMIAPNGQMVAYAEVVVGRDEDGRVKPEMTYLRSNIDGTQRKRIGTYVKSPTPTQVKVPIDEKRNAIAGIPFLTFPGMTYTSDGTRFGAITHTFAGRGGSYHVMVVRTNGDTLFSRDYPFVGVPIPTAVRDSAIDAIPRRRSSGGALLYEPKIGARVRDAAAPLTPHVYRAVEGMIIGRDNTTWLTMRPDGDARTVIALNAKGDPVLSVRLPLNAELRDASLTTLWVVEKDADDLPSVVRYRIQ